jgi:hypothetical protein
MAWYRQLSIVGHPKEFSYHYAHAIGDKGTAANDAVREWSRSGQLLTGAAHECT